MKVIMRDSIIKQRPVALIAWVFLVSVIFAAAAAGAAESVSNDVCLSCHSTPGLEKLRQGKKVSLSVDSERFSKSAHGPFPCIACHSDITQVPHAPDLKRVACAQCHS